MAREFIHELFRRTAGRFPEGVAVQSPDRTLYYAELDHWSDNVAATLRERGLEKGDRVAIPAQNTFVVIASILGVLKAGGVFVPLDPTAPERRLRPQLELVDPRFCLTEERFSNRIRELSGVGSEVAVLEVDREKAVDGRPCLLPRRADGGWQNLLEVPQTAWKPDDPCYVYFTSGSSGRPKAILGRLMAIDHFVLWESETFGVGPSTRVSQVTGPTFDAFLRDALTPLCAGGCVVVPRDRETLLAPESLARWLEDERVEVLHCVPSLFRVLLRSELGPERFPALRHVLLAGEVLLPSDVRRWYETVGERVGLVNLYGPSETTMVKLFHRVEPADAERRSVPIGQPMPGARALVLNEAGAPCPVGMVGEIHIRTPYRSLGYLGDEELTAGSFVPNPLSGDPDDVVYRTGDLGRLLESGDLEFLGRRDHQVKIRGLRVELDGIEDLILGSGRVKEAAVADRRDVAGNSYLVAYLVPDGDEGDMVSAVRQALAEDLPEALVPSSFVVLESLPKTATGKVDRKSLPAPDEVADTAPYEAPRNEVEEVLAAAFASVLDRPRVGIRDDFFQIGGHSLLAMVLLARASKELDVEVPLGLLFEAPTVAELASRIDELKASVAGSEVAGVGEGGEAAVDLDSALDNLDQLSDDEVDSLLAEIQREAS